MFSHIIKIIIKNELISNGFESAWCHTHAHTSLSLPSIGGYSWTQKEEGAEQIWGTRVFWYRQHF